MKQQVVEKDLERKNLFTTRARCRADVSFTFKASILKILLIKRQRWNPAPYLIFALNLTNLHSKVPSGAHIDV